MIPQSAPVFEPRAGWPRASHPRILGNALANGPGHLGPPRLNVGVLQLIHHVLGCPRPSVNKQPTKLLNDTWPMSKLSLATSHSSGPADLPSGNQGLNPSDVGVVLRSTLGTSLGTGPCIGPEFLPGTPPEQMEPVRHYAVQAGLVLLIRWWRPGKQELIHEGQQLVQPGSLLRLWADSFQS